MFPPFGPSADLGAPDDDRAVVLEPTPAQRVTALLLNDPAFRVLTVDGLAWLDPYTGMRIAAPLGYLDPATAYLLANEPWTHGKPGAVADLHRLRWRLYLAEQLEGESRLRLFGPDGRWLNPFTLAWVALPTRADLITPQVVEEMATALAHSPGLRQIPIADAVRLDEVMHQARQQRLAPPVARAAVLPATVDPPTTITTRVDPIIVDEATGQERVVERPVERTVDRHAIRAQGLAQARQVFARMLPARPTIPGCALATFYEPFSAVGGDFYECAQLIDGRSFIALGDVSGHGAQGAMVALATLKALRFILREHDDPVDILALLNDELRRDLRPGQFVTMIAGVLDGDQFTVLRAGHHQALRLSHGRSVLERIGEPGAALGVRDQVAFRRSLTPVTVTLAPGDRVVFTSDGLSEAVDRAGNQYGEPRLMGMLVALLDVALATTVARVAADVKRYAGGALQDDATMLALEFIGGEILDAPAVETPAEDDITPSG